MSLAVKDIPGIRLSLVLGLVPQRNRRDIMISDYSFFGVNDDTVPLAPPEAMQFGQTFRRLLQRITNHANEQFGPVYMTKIDLSDDFYRLWLLRPEDTLKLTVLFSS